MRISSSYAPRMRRWRRLMPSLSKPRDSYKRRALPFEPKTESSAFLKPRARINSTMASQRELVEHLRPAALAAREERFHLLLQLGRELRVDVGEEGLDRGRRTSLDLLDCRLEEVFELDPELVFGILRPQSLQLEVLPHPFDRIALRPGIDLVLRPIARRVVAR